MVAASERTFNARSGFVLFASRAAFGSQQCRAFVQYNWTSGKEPLVLPEEIQCLRFAVL